MGTTLNSRTECAILSCLGPLFVPVGHPGARQLRCRAASSRRDTVQATRGIDSLLVGMLNRSKEACGIEQYNLLQSVTISVRSVYWYFYIFEAQFSDLLYVSHCDAAQLGWTPFQVLTATGGWWLPAGACASVSGLGADWGELLEK